MKTKCEECNPGCEDVNGAVEKYDIIDKDDVGIGEMWLCEYHADGYIDDGCEVEIISNCSR